MESDLEVEPPLQKASRCDDHNYSLPHAAELKRRLDAMTERAELAERRVRNKARKVACLKGEVASLRELSAVLDKKEAVSEKPSSDPLSFKDPSEEIFKRYLHNKEGTVSRGEYPPEVKAFALRLNLYSTKAYQ